MTEQNAATRWGVIPGYHDVFGRWHAPTDAAIARLVPALSAARDAPVPWPTPNEPRKAYQCGDQKMWGLAVQLYAVRSRRNWGHGDFGDLAEIVRGAAAVGASAVGLNPLHALFPDRAEDASPYSPSSRYFLNPLYIDIEAMPEFPGLRRLAEEADNLGLASGIDFERAVAALRETDMVAYARVAEIKRAALQICHARFRVQAAEERRADFAAFVKQEDVALKRFAAFQLLRSAFAQASWRDWPEEWRAPDEARIAVLQREQPLEFEFVLYTQWIAERQLQACQTLAKQSGMPVGLYIDMAVGVHPDGADAWSRQSEVLSGVTIGAPPDQYNPAGQNWGLTTFNPHALAAAHCEPLREMLRASMRHAGAIRIDHVLGLMRLYLIPQGAGAGDGAYVSFPFEAMLAAIAEESVAQACIVIGEDLGTVPEGFRDTLQRYGIWTYLVMLFERDHDGAFRDPVHYPRNALAAFSTHDLPTFTGWMSGDDLKFKRAIGVDPGESNEDRAHAHRAMLKALDGDKEFPAVAAFLARSSARLVMIGIEDICGIVEQINIPGTVEQHPNWRRRLPMDISEAFGSESLQRVAHAMREQGRAFR